MRVEIKFCLMLISLPYELFQEAPFPLKQFVLMGLKVIHVDPECGLSV